MLSVTIEHWAWNAFCVTMSAILGTYLGGTRVMLTQKPGTLVWFTTDQYIIEFSNIYLL